MKSDTDNYLKYWRVIREFVKVRYNLTQADLDMLLCLYSEKYFGQDKFKEYDLLLQWSTDRFHRLRKDGWIEKFRNQVAGRKALYRLTIKSTRMIQSVYRKLNGEEIPVSPSSNKMFRKNVPYTHKIYKDMIIEMNNAIKQQRHRAPE